MIIMKDPGDYETLEEKVEKLIRIGTILMPLAIMIKNKIEQNKNEKK